MAADLRTRFARLARRMAWAAAVRGAVAWLARLSAAVLLLCWCDNLAPLPVALRLAAILGLLVWALPALWTGVLAPLRRSGDAEAAALAAERAAGRDDNLLINACQLGGADLPPASRALVVASLAEAERISGALPLPRLLGLRRLAWWGAVLAIAAAAWSGYAATAPVRAGNALGRLLAPLADRPPVGAVAIEMDPVGTRSQAEGDDLVLTVRVRILDPAAASASPVVAWAEGREALDEDGGGAEILALAEAGPGCWRGVLTALRRDLVLRARCAGVASPGLVVRVLPRPRLSAARWLVQPPAYAAAPAGERPGPPARVAVLPGSHLRLEIATAPAVEAIAVEMAGRRLAARREGGGWIWEGEGVAGSIAILGTWAGRTAELARSALVQEEDRPPIVLLEGGGTARSVAPGTALELAVEAEDDLGLRRLALTVRDTGGGPEPVRTWSQGSQPGSRRVAHRHRLVVDPARFQPGRAYLVEAVAEDWNPVGSPVVGRALLLRVQAVDDLRPADPSLASACDSLRRAIARQRQAEGQSDNLRVQDVIDLRRLAAHRAAIAAPQGQARAAAREAAQRFATARDEATARALALLVDGEMDLVERDLAAIAPPEAAVRRRLTALHERQAWIADRLTALLGSAVARFAPAATGPAAGLAEPEGGRDRRELTADVADLVREQQQVVERSRSLLDASGLDLTEGHERLLGELARRETELACRLDELCADFSRLPAQDMADASLATQFNVVYQEIARAAAALYQRRIELAVPHEQSGLELAVQLQHNLERWLSDRPDVYQWSMEEALVPADVPLGELPKQLEDIVGDLLDREEAMQADIEDVTSAWMDNLDKGAGWTAADGPISNMSARGVTGNLLPNQNEVGGRSGEGRSGRSHGQMVEAEAWGKSGRQTPTRLTPSTFEAGRVTDHSDETGGATGGGKLAGADAEGLRGPVPPALGEAMRRLAAGQARLHQEAETLALRLRRQGAPLPGLEAATAAMRAVAEAAQRGDGGAIRSRYAEAVDALRDGRRALVLGGLGRERIRLERSQREGLGLGAPGMRPPPGYEDLTARYFRALAEEKP